MRVSDSVHSRESFNIPSILSCVERFEKMRMDTSKRNRTFCKADSFHFIYLFLAKRNHIKLLDDGNFIVLLFEDLE